MSQEPPPNNPSPPSPASPPDPDHELLDELTAPPPLDEAKQSLTYWEDRLHDLPHHRRAERREARAMVERWQGHVRDAERAQYGPGPLERLLDLAGIRWRPNRRRLALGLGLAGAIVLVMVIALLVAAVVFWSDIEPIVRTLTNGGNGGGGEGGGGEGGG